MLRMASPALAKDSIATTPLTRSPSLSAANTAVAYRLPFEAPQLRVDQAPNGRFSHQDEENRDAVDFALPEATLVMAAREGRETAARALLKLGANPALTNQAGYNAAGYAMKAQRQELAFEIMKKEKALRKAPLKPSPGN